MKAKMTGKMAAKKMTNKGFKMPAMKGMAKKMKKKKGY